PRLPEMPKMRLLAISIVVGVAGLFAVSLPYSGIKNCRLGYMVASFVNVACQPAGWPCQRTYEVSAKTSNDTPWFITVLIQEMLAFMSPPLSMCRTVLMRGSTAFTAAIPCLRSPVKFATLAVVLRPVTGGTVGVGRPLASQMLNSNPGVISWPT